MMGRKPFFPVDIADFDVPVSGVRVHCRKHCGLHNTTDEFVHERKNVQFAYVDAIQFPIVDEELA